MTNIKYKNEYYQCPSCYYTISTLERISVSHNRMCGDCGEYHWDQFIPISDLYKFLRPYGFSVISISENIDPNPELEYWDQKRYEDYNDCDDE